MTTTFWIEITIMICSIYSGFAWAWIIRGKKIADLEFDNHILEAEAESAWHQLYVQTYGNKSEVKLAEESEYDKELERLLALEDEILERNGFNIKESSLEKSKRNHPSNGNNEIDKIKFVANNLIPQNKKNNTGNKKKEIDGALRERMRKEWNES